MIASSVILRFARVARSYLPVFVVSLSVVVADQLTKWLVRQSIPLHSRTNVLPSLDLTHLRNPGIAFGMLRDMPDRIRFWFYAAIFVFAVGAIVLFLRNIEAERRALRLSLALLLGGAIGNCADRFFYGYVTDFIAVYWPGNPHLVWPPFNVADAAITVGAISVFVCGMLEGRRRK